ncbi:MAG: ribose-5-phosphate isomerase RpiA [Hyphomicrobiales bacterium]|nr:ribose-5-phosphate isomerase RpiA [Hyphomicrobiales bacterium]
MSDALKKLAGQAALEFVQDGMKLGIGTGSTAEAFIRVLGEKVADGLQIIGVPTSERTRALCEELNIPLTTLDDTPQLDLTIDGADEIDPSLSLIKGGGGALLREKIVAAASDDMLVIADESKLVDPLGAFPLPIEVNPFGLAATKIMIEGVAEELGLSGPLDLRMVVGDTPFITDGGHYILDASFGRIVDPKTVSVALNGVPGVVEHGLFTGLASRAIITNKDGARIVEAADKT